MRAVAVCVPVRNMFHTAFAIDMARAVAFHTDKSDDRVPVLIDHDPSKEIRHLGGFEYDLNHAWLISQADDSCP